MVERRALECGEQLLAGPGPLAYSCASLEPQEVRISMSHLTPARGGRGWLLCEDFEAGGGDIDTWYAASDFNSNGGLDDPGRMRLATDHVHGGSHSLHMPAAARSGYRGANLDWRKRIGPEQQSPCPANADGDRMASYEELYFRTYVRFAEDHRAVNHFLNIAGGTPDRYSSLGSSGCLRTGELSIAATVDFEAESHNGFFYTYFPEMRCSTNCVSYLEPEQLSAQCAHCDDIGMPTCGGSDGPMCCWGNEFRAGTPASFPTGRWFCFAMLLRANTPSVHDGIMAYWIDGGLIHEVSDMMWRTSPDVALNRVGLQHYITSSDAGGHSNRVWFDDVVVSTERIGCN